MSDVNGFWGCVSISMDHSGRAACLRRYRRECFYQRDDSGPPAAGGRPPSLSLVTGSASVPIGAPCTAASPPPPTAPKTITNPVTEESGGPVRRRPMRSAADAPPADWVFIRETSRPRSRLVCPFIRRAPSRLRSASVLRPFWLRSGSVPRTSRLRSGSMSVQFR